MGEWYWCMKHGAAEEGLVCKADDRLGPYPSEQAARAWRETSEAREDRWQEQDEAWHGPAD